MRTNFTQHLTERQINEMVQMLEKLDAQKSNSFAGINEKLFVMRLKRILEVDNLPFPLPTTPFSVILAID